ncbi:hypothetical protein P885DRAFT_43743 [Corynascus similis CBS 632.67]
MDITDEDSDVLYDLACECEALFDARLAELRNQQSPLAELLAEYQQRFAIWAAHLGVFARRSQSLDKRLENYPDIIDLAARLLDILRRSLAQRDPTESKTDGISQQLANDDQRSRDAALAILEATLPRLNRLGVTIRQASREKMVLKIEKFAISLNLRSFTDASRSVVQVLYPDSHQSLREYLAKSMTNRFAAMLYLSHRGAKLQSRRSTRSPGFMPTIGEGEELASRPIPPDRNAQAGPGRGDQASRAQPKGLSTASESDLSTINSKLLRQAMRKTNYLKAPVERLKGTSSVQVSQGNYPPPPFQKNTNIAPCKWCGTPMDKREITESEWRRHTDDDLKPYPCISEECPEGHPVYPSFGLWFSHMKSHNKKWHQRVYLTPGWVCVVCDDSHEVYRSAGALHLHLTEAHQDMFDASRLHAISRQSKIERPRAGNECLLCCFTVEEIAAGSRTGLPKRQKKQLHQDSDKRSRTALEMRDQNPLREVEDSSDASDDSLDAENELASDNAELMARHIAGHLQALMLLTIRLASLQNEEDDDDGQDANSDSVDLGDTSEATRTKDPEETTDRGAPEDIEMPDANEIPDHVVDLPGHSSIPDADVDFADIGVRRQYDDLPAEKDGFLQQLIKSGAYQAHLNADFEEGCLMQDVTPNIITVNYPGYDVEDPIGRIVTPPEMKRPLEKSKYDGPNADVRIDNVVQPHDLVRFQRIKPASESGFEPAMMPLFKSRDPSCERDRPMINVVLPTPGTSPSPEEVEARRAAAEEALSDDEESSVRGSQHTTVKEDSTVLLSSDELQNRDDATVEGFWFGRHLGPLFQSND